MRAVLLDLDGVVYAGDEALPGAPEAVAWLRTEGIPYRFVTNTTSRPREAVVAKLGSMGVSAATDDVQTPAVTALAWLRRHNLRHPALFVPEATAAELAELDPVDDRVEGGAGAVVVGDLGRSWDFPTLNRAFRLLMAENAPPLLALGLTRYWRADDGLRLDAGAFVKALEYAAGRPAVVLGKPDCAFYGSAVEALGVPADEVVMVGDDVVTDVAGAQRCGLTGVLVRTGKFSPTDLTGDVAPDAVLESLADLPRWWGAS